MKDKDYRSSIKVVSTVIPDVKLILNKFLKLKDIELLKKEVLDNNLLLKSSKRRSETIFYEIRKRYLFDQLDGYQETSFIYLIDKVKSDAIIEPILYFYLCKEEKILYEYITELVYEKYRNGFLGITSEDTSKFIIDLTLRDEKVAKWSERTINDVRSGIMGVLKEFGFINSRKRPTFNKVFTPSIVFYYVLYENKENISTLEELYNCKDFKLLLLLENDLKILIEEAYRNRILDFENNEQKTLIYNYKTIKEIIDIYADGEIF